MRSDTCLAHGTVRHHLALATCRKCPAHGACSEDKLLRCSSNYILEKPLLGMPYCRADTEKLANVEALVSEVKETLAVRAGQIECGEMAGDKVVTEADLSRQLHKNHVSDYKPVKSQCPYSSFLTDVAAEMVRCALQRLLVYCRSSA
jgi:hypothetical protein